MAHYVVATTKSWNVEKYGKLVEAFPEEEFCLVTDKEQLTEELLKDIKPRYVFFPHWSWIIPKEIYNNYECVVFHMTDLPFGRGGSPLQNLIVRGIYNTKVSAIKVEAGLDTGPVYMKVPIDISEGNADEILSRVADIVFSEMIPAFIKGNLVASEQSGEVVSFARRKPEESRIPDGLSQRQLYDYIRMLDGEGYPAAYFEENGKKIYLRNAVYKENKVYAEACIEGREP
jgi:methionyl-tRNA formyltransferase